MRNRRVTPKALIVGVLLIAIATLFLKLDQRKGLPGPVGRVVSNSLAPLQTAVTTAGSSVRVLWKDYVALRRVREQNKRLIARLGQLKERAAESADLAAENERLRRLLDLGDRRKDLRLRAARVLSRTTSPYFRVVRLVLDTGDAPAKPGMPVIAPGGVVGQLRSIDGTHAEVLLITDPRSAIDVVLEKSRARGVAVGTGEADQYAARLEYLQHADRAQKGERVITTGDDGRYPRGLVVGEVVEVAEAGSGPFRAARIRPMVDLGALDEVFVSLGPTGLTPDGRGLEKRKTKKKKSVRAP